MPFSLTNRDERGRLCTWMNKVDVIFNERTDLEDLMYVGDADEVPCGEVEARLGDGWEVSKFETIDAALEFAEALGRSDAGDVIIEMI